MVTNRVLETMEHMVGFRELLSQGPCAAYTKLKTEYEFGESRYIKAILSPFISNNFDPQSLSGFTSLHSGHRGRI